MMYKYLIFIALLVFLVSFGLYSSQPKINVIVESSPTPTAQLTFSAEKLTALVNEWRISQGFQPYIKNNDLCRIAKDRVLNDPELDNHEGLYKKYSNYPSAIQENLDENASEESMLIAWLESPPHKATLEKPYKYSCIYCKDNYCSHIFSNLENGSNFNYAE